jgi:TPP-dependent 2-oxoacid decarboxylase
MNQVEKNALFSRVANEIADTLAKKNHDYGDSFHDVYTKHGDISTFIRLSDKISRYETLLTKSAKVDESIDDVLRDIAGYCILTLVSKERLK